MAGAADAAREARRKLELRQEKLQAVEDQAGDLADTASEFQALAQRLKEQQQIRPPKWW